ncbi:17110_t:CDS:2, partial [Funneliformis caledonium]
YRCELAFSYVRSPISLQVHDRVKPNPKIACVLIGLVLARPKDLKHQANLKITYTPTIVHGLT